MINMIFEFAEITRLDDESRVCEGYAFRNEVVSGEGGIRLMRSAMENATPEYMKFGNLRAMHQPIAAGLVQDAKWDEKGMFITTRVVDDNEWKKVKEGVYKGFSVGVRPRIMRGKNVEAADIVEISLVDRPKDPDALISCFRAEDIDQPFEVEFRSELSTEELAKLPNTEFGDPDNRKYPVLDQDDIDSAVLALGEGKEDIKKVIVAIALRKNLSVPEGWIAVANEGAAEETPADPDTEARVDSAENKEDVAPIAEAIDYVARVQELEGQVARISGLETELTEANSQKEELLQRLNKVEAEFVEVQAKLDSAKAQLQQLKTTPIKQPVRYAKAFDRDYAHSYGPPAVNAEMVAEIEKVKTEIASTKDEGRKLALLARLNVLNNSI